ncbi:hypothetical protein OHD62_17490 [Mesorhizobium sp. YC-39]|uniref:hypothetical protein n=1 Tax=unclassified Mesorhizobium TaxID=325217 RepID=UPI0021E8105C|nr:MULTISPECIES: hypothetical protein [unclassified Mesorhizobium]MCV3209638.1 hypothetical protein [Mesorhizobium sp. YC-2]MCV3230168.1 hypothetical protein [Mesorhizobium sp. YC-39]
MNARLNRSATREVADRAPLDHLEHTFDLEPMSVPPDGSMRLVCHRFPECMCGDDCAEAGQERERAHGVLIALMVATLTIGALLLAACVTRQNDFTADQLGALGPVLKGERP